MILDVLIDTFKTFVTTVFGILPSLPQIDPTISNAANYMLNLVSSVTKVFIYLYGQGLYLAIIALLIALIAFDQIYHLIRWTAQKIPMLAIK